MKQKHFAIMVLAILFMSCEKEDTRSPFEKEASYLLGSYELIEVLWGSNEVDFNGDGVYTNLLLDEYKGMPGYNESFNTFEVSFSSENGEECVVAKMNLPLPEYVKVDTGYIVDKVVYMPVELKYKNLVDEVSVGEMHKWYEMEYGVVDYICSTGLHTYNLINAHSKMIENRDEDFDCWIYYHFKKKE